MKTNQGGKSNKYKREKTKCFYSQVTLLVMPAIEPAIVSILWEKDKIQLLFPCTWSAYNSPRSALLQTVPLSKVYCCRSTHKHAVKGLREK